MKVRMIVATTVMGVVRESGEVIEVPDGIGASLIRAGRAEEVKAAKRGQKEKATKEPPEKAVKE